LRVVQVPSGNLPISPEISTTRDYIIIIIIMVKAKNPSYAAQHKIENIS